MPDELPTLSVIIANYNYGKYIAASIESALKIDWPHVEIIVVDDGSKDDSAEVIKRYLPAGVCAFYQQNEGQASASDWGVRESTGDFVLFLDADDMTHPSIMREVYAHRREGASKYQFQLRTIDANGEPLGNIFPRFPREPSPADIKKWAKRTGSYPTPPGPGNVYTRAFLDIVFPLKLGMDRAPDSYCLPVAPFLGDVVTIPKPLVSYRIHDSNMAAMGVLKPEKFSLEFQRALNRAQYARELLSEYGIVLSPERHRRSLQNLSLRVASLRLTPDMHPLRGDTRLALLRDLAMGACTPQGKGWRAHLAFCGWVTAAAVLSRAAARRLFEWRYVPAARPYWIRSLLPNI